MHIPAKFKQTDTETLIEFIQTFPLGTLITSDNGALDAGHFPFLVKTHSNQSISLQSHIAKVNPLWKSCQDNQEVLLIFHGPNAYVSPNFYPSKQQTGKAVPTWNYAVVHVKGRIFFKHQRDWLMPLLDELSNQHESNQPSPWSISDAPMNYIEKLIKAVVGLEIIIDSMVGNFKLSQNKSAADYAGVIQGLSGSGLDSAVALANYMQQSDEQNVKKARGS
jgi:transcriptional regulator